MATITITGTAANYVVGSSNTTLTNLGTIGGTVGIDVLSGLSGDVVLNAATISVGGTGLGVRLRSASTLTNQSGGTISGYKAVIAYNQPSTVTNDGAILGALTSALGAGVQFINGGTLTNGSGATIAGYVGILDQSGRAAVTNAGTISGAKDAVLLAAGAANLLVIDPGAVFSGTVDGSNTIGATAVSTLELASGSSPGTLSGLGTQFIDFGQIDFDAGATWTLAGTNSVYSNTYLLNTYVVDGGSLTNTGLFSGEVTVAGGGLLDNTGSLAGGQGVPAALISSSATLVNSGVIGVGGAMYAVAIGGGAAVTNQSGGTINGSSYGVFSEGGGTVVNAGSVGASGGSGVGINLGVGGLVTNQASATVSGYDGVIAYGGVVLNAGTILGDVAATSGRGIWLRDGGTVTNQSGGTIAGFKAVISYKQPATVTNYGAILGDLAAYTGAGVQFINDGTLTNQSGGTISAYNAVVANAGGTVTNSGTILGNANAAHGVGVRLIAGGTLSNQSGGTINGRYGVIAYAGGTVTNQSGGTITGYAAVFLDQPATVTNAGIIQGNTTASHGSGAVLRNGGMVTNQSGGTIAGYEAVYSKSGGTLTNEQGGTIDGYKAVYLKSGGTLTNERGGTIDGVSGIVGNGGATVTNGGVILGTGKVGAQFAYDGVLTNQSGATISGPNGVIANAGFVMTNGGAILGNTTSLGGRGVYLLRGGTVTNQSGGTISGYRAVVSYKVVVTVVNAGIILGNTTGTVSTGIGVRMKVGGTLTNQSSATVVGFTGVLADAQGTVLNAGTILGGTAASGGTGVRFATGGTVANQTGGTIAGYVGMVDQSGATTLTNAGTIFGTQKAVQLAAGATNRVVVDPGAGFAGTVDGGNTIGATSVSTLELASGSSGGTLSGLGTHYINFAQITVDPGATWTFAGANTVASGVTLTDSGMLSNAGLLSGNVTLGAGALLDNIGTLSGSGIAAVRGPASSAATVVNAGLIDPAAYGVYLPMGGVVTNISNGTILGTSMGVFAPGGPLTLTNAGSIGGGAVLAAYGVYLPSGGSVTNQISGVISGDIGIYGKLGVTVTNTGTIAGPNGSVRLAAGATNRVVIDPGAVFSGSVNGGNALGSTVVSTLELAAGTSAGTFSGLGTQFVRFAQVALDSGADWLLTGSNTILSGQTLTVNGTLVNAGTIGGSAIELAAGALLSNVSGGTISGNQAVDVLAGAATVVNAGIISGNPTAGTGQGVVLDGGGSVTNQSGGTISGYKAIISYGPSTTVGNYGAIFGALTAALGAGVQFINGGTLTNQSSATVSGYSGVIFNAGGTVTNSGTILGNATASGARGIRLIDGGTVSNQTDGTIAGYVGILDQAGAATVTNAGTISGASNAVLLAAGATNLLVIDPGAVFSGTVDGGNTIGATAVSTLELASGSSGGTLSGLGTQFIDFGQIDFDAGATWTLAGTNSVYSNTYLLNTNVVDGGSLTNTGLFNGQVTVAAGGLLDNTGSLAGGQGVDAVQMPASNARLVNSGVIGVSGALYAVEIAGGAAVTNQSGGTINGGSYGVLSLGGGTVVNQAGGHISAVFGVATSNGDTVLNEGTISGNSAGVFMRGGALSNDGGYIRGVNGVGAATYAATVTNAGRIVGHSSGVSLAAGGQITNSASGTIYGGLAGVFSAGAITIVNQGSLIANPNAGSPSYSYGVSLSDGGLVTNQAGGLIAGSGGVVVRGAAGTVINFGSIRANPAYYRPSVYLAAGGLLINQAGGTMTGYTGLWIKGDGTVINYAVIAAQHKNIYVIGDGWLTNQADGTISGSIVAVSDYSGALTLTNAGHIYGNTYDGAALLLLGGLVTNQASGTISANDGIEMLAQATVVNAGVVVGTGADGTFSFGIQLDKGGALTNSGTILGNATVALAGGVVLYASGSVINQTSGLIASYVGIGGHAGATTVTNGGTISGNKVAVGLAAGGANRVVIDPGGVFVGIVDGGNKIGAAAISTLELASGSSPGTLSGLGTQYVDFAQITIDAGAAWTLTGTNAVGAGTLSNAGQLSGDVTLGAGGLLDNTGTLSGSGGAAVQGLASGGATVINAGLIDPAIDGVYLPGGGVVTNISGGTITGSSFGVLVAGSAGTVSNYGTISGGSDGVHMNAGGTVVNGLHALIDGVGGNGIQIENAAGSVANQGSITGTGSGVLFIGGSYLTNSSGATISGGSDGVFGDDVADAITISNHGVLAGNAGALGGHGVLLNGGGQITNQAGGTISGYRAVGAYNASATVTNDGVILGNTTGTISKGMGVRIADGGALTNQSGATITGYAGVFADAGATVLNAGTIVGIGDAVLLQGGSANRVVIDPGGVFVGTVDGGNAIGSAIISTLELASGSGTGTLSGLGSRYVDFAQVALDSGATWQVAGSIASSETIVFGGPGAYLHLNDPLEAAGSVTSFGAGETIDLQGIAPGSVGYSGGVLTFGAGGSFPLAITGGDTLHVASSADGTQLTALCFCIGTLIQTPRGQVKVQDLCVGDLVMTHSGVARPITWIGTGAVSATRGRRTAATPVIVRKGALADNVPFQDLHITKGHALFFDGVLIPAEFLVNHRSILWDDRAQRVELFHIELACHDVLWANGSPAESYRDDGNRWLFDNANSGWDQPPKPPFAPVLTGGPIVDAVWRRLLDRAGSRPGVPLTGASDLYLLCNGERIDGRHTGDGVAFFLPRQPPLAPSGVTCRVAGRAGARTRPAPTRRSGEADTTLAGTSPCARRREQRLARGWVSRLRAGGWDPLDGRERGHPGKAVRRHERPVNAVGEAWWQDALPR